MSLNLNFSGVESGFPKVAEGDHVMVIDDAELKDAANGQSQNLILSLSVASSDQEEEIGKKMKEYINIQESTMWRVKLFFEAMVGEEVEEIDMEPSDLVGQTFIATVEHDEKYANIVAFASN